MTMQFQKFREILNPREPPQALAGTKLIDAWPQQRKSNCISMPSSTMLKFFEMEK
jgi:hypothetical protein